MRPVEEHTFRTHDGVELFYRYCRPVSRLALLDSTVLHRGRLNIWPGLRTLRTLTARSSPFSRRGRAVTVSSPGDRWLQLRDRHVGAGQWADLCRAHHLLPPESATSRTWRSSPSKRLRRQRPCATWAHDYGPSPIREHEFRRHRSVQEVERCPVRPRWTSRAAKASWPVLRKLVRASRGLLTHDPARIEILQDGSTQTTGTSSAVNILLGPCAYRGAHRRGFASDHRSDAAAYFGLRTGSCIATPRHRSRMSVSARQSRNCHILPGFLPRYPWQTKRSVRRHRQGTRPHPRASRRDRLAPAIIAVEADRYGFHAARRDRTNRPLPCRSLRHEACTGVTGDEPRLEIWRIVGSRRHSPGPSNRL